MLQNIWRYRQFIASWVKREFLMRYTGSMLGILWSVFQPLAMIFIYTVIFSQVMRSKLAGMDTVPFAYSIYLCAGVLNWGLFTETLNNCTNVFLANGNLLKKVSFPRICLPVITACSAFLNYIIGFALFLVFLVIIGRFPFGGILYYFLVLLVQTVFTLGLGVGLGVLNVFFRDVYQSLNVILQFWFWFTPVVYPLTIIPEQFRWLMNLNPMYHIVHGYQSVFVFGERPDFAGIFAVLALGAALALWSLRLYRQHVGEMVDEL